jgi:hypothetical protein
MNATQESVYGSIHASGRTTSSFKTSFEPRPAKYLWRAAVTADDFRHLPAPARARNVPTHGAEHIARLMTLNQLINLKFWRTDMKIENLGKELDTETMTEVKGGIALTGQVVPTNVQSNELLQSFNIASNGPVAIANDGSQSNYSDQDSFVPVGSLFLTPSLEKLVR